MERTTRERIADRLRDGPATVRQLSRAVGASESAVYDDLRHVARSLDEAAERFLVAPPTCRDCGFDAFDDPINRPSRCPDCRSERIESAVFKIE